MSGTVAFGVVPLVGADIAVHWDKANGRGDWAMAGPDLATTDPLASAVLISLFTDRLASPDFTPTDGTTDRRGWWGDTYNPRQIGSRLWQLERAKKTSATGLLLQARDFCAEALQWLIEDGVAATVTVSPSWLTPSVMAIVVVINKPVGPASTFAYQWAWNGVA